MVNEHDYEGKMRGHMKHRRKRIQVRTDGDLDAPRRSASLRPLIRVPMRLKSEAFVGTNCTPGAESEEWTLPLLIRFVASRTCRVKLEPI